MTYNKRNRTVLGLSLAAAVVALGACGGGGDDSSGSSGAAEEPTSQSSDTDAESGTDASKPDLDGIPDVVAEVNGEEVTKDEFVPVYEAQFQQATARASGKAPDQDALKTQAAKTLVDAELLAQEADARGITVSDDDIDAELTSLAKQNQMASSDELLAAIEKQGTTEEQARHQVESQLLIERLVADEAGPIKPTEKDLHQIYDQAKQAMAAQADKSQPVPSFAKVRSQLVAQAKSNEQADVAQKLVDGLRKDADITMNL